MGASTPEIGIDWPLVIQASTFFIIVVGLAAALLKMLIAGLLVSYGERINAVAGSVAKVAEDVRDLETRIRSNEITLQRQEADARVELTKNREKLTEVETQLRSFEKQETRAWAQHDKEEGDFRASYAEFRRAAMGRTYGYGEVTTPAQQPGGGPHPEVRQNISHPKMPQGNAE